MSFWNGVLVGISENYVLMSRQFENCEWYTNIITPRLINIVKFIYLVKMYSTYKKFETQNRKKIRWNFLSSKEL